MMGGFCRFWFVPIEEVESIPAINPLTQAYISEPVLKAGKLWRGPVPVPERQLGFTEVMRNGKSGPYFEIRVSSIYAGDIPASRSNFDNMAYHQYLVVGKMRSSGAYVLIGHQEAGADFTGDFDSGTANGNAALHKIEFSLDQINKALVLPSFDGTESGFVDFSGQTVSIDNDYWILE